MAFDTNKILEPARLVFNNKSRKDVEINGVSYNDDEALRTYIRTVFPEDGQKPNPSMLWDFNTVLVKISDEYVVKPRLQTILSHLAAYENADKNTSLKVVKVAQDADVKWTISATGAGAKAVKIGRDRLVHQKPFNISLALQYDMLTKGEDEVSWFRKAVNMVGESQIKFIYGKVMGTVRKGTVAGIPSKNIVERSNALTYSDIKELGRVIQRRTGGKPVLLADELMLDFVADKMTGDTVLREIMTRSAKDEVFSTYGARNLGAVTGLPLENGYVTDDNSKLYFEPSEGIMFGANDSQKPFLITKIGGMVQQTKFADVLDHTVVFVAEQEMAIELVYPNRVGLVTEDTITA